MPFSLLGARSDVTCGPRGVIGIICSWNAPRYTLMAPLSSAIVAGNSAILKPGEFVPATGAPLARLIRESFGSADLAQATHRIALGKGANSGQICIAPDTIHVPREHVEDFFRLLLDQYKRHFGAMGTTSALASERQKQRFDALIADARASGAEVQSLEAEAAAAAGRFFQ